MPSLPDVPSAPPRSQPGAAPTRDARSARALLAQAQRQFRDAAAAEHQSRTRQLEDQRFDASDQWDPILRQQREADRRPCLTINRIHAGVKQIANEQRNNPPSVTVNPVDDSADIATAEVFQGIIRNIETTSDAPVAYETAGESAARIGLGYLRVYTEYSDDQSFQQQIRIARILNRFTVYVDPGASEHDKRDMRYAFITADYAPEVVKERWPQAKAGTAGAEDFASLGDTFTDWYPEGTVRVAEYFWIEESTQTLGLFGGQALPREQWPAGQTPERERPVRVKTVRWALITGFDVLEQTEVPGTRIPIIPVVGDESLDDKGRVDYRGIVRDARDPQKINNAMESAIVEQIGLGPRAPYVMAEGQDEGYEDLWKTANSRNWARLVYKPVTVDGTLVGPPQRNVVEPPIQATTIAAQRAENNLRGVMGFMDVHANERQGNEQSGRAILARQAQAQQGNVNYLDNLARAVRSLGRLLLEWIPIVYEYPQIVRITGLDDQPRKVMVHGQPGGAGGLPPEQLEAYAAAKGIQGVFDLSTGRYDVTVTSGPSYQSRRQEAAAAMVEYVRAYPPAFPLIGDLLTKNMDWPGSQEIAQRLKKMLPPPLQDQQQGDGPPLPPQAQQAMSQAQQQIQQLQQQLQEAQGALAGDQLKAKTQLQVADMNNRADLQKARIVAETQLAVARMTQGADLFAQERDRVGVEQEAMRDRTHELHVADLTHRQTLREAQLDAQHQAAQMAQQGLQSRAQQLDGFQQQRQAATEDTDAELATLLGPGAPPAEGE